ncbi:MAG: DUF5320 domain-containing protein [Promethearchaeota archaeon]
MPGGDRTGPRGQGPMTGRGLGYCAGYDSPGFTAGAGYGLGRGYGRGYGRGWGRGRGYGMGWGYRDPYYTSYRSVGTYYTPRVPIAPPADQLTMLNQEKSYLESELKGVSSAIEDISKRIAELEKKE